ncbi:hypothetical protein HNO88_002228 [Novosphingobium chloroacetimidivorans]|uniref:DUF11 domain-containing protein n=1 Tax=Novosphingobium chloroacetimidivorans TaxID=1428314 RepID=A0A7W7K9W3_9SPHN|nr:carboxypeptidase-like regulatory domain-containing protein [Novosphingobium chloroacetimidivorans]MBB4858902.1 hypothetical protein [Novosphingobium chloroacetimidivorans]
MLQLRRILCQAAALLGLTSIIAAPADAQTRVENTAVFRYRVPTSAEVKTIASNTTTLDVVPVGRRAKRPTKLSFRRIDPTYTFGEDLKDACVSGSPPTFKTFAVNQQEVDSAAPLGSLDIAKAYVIVLENEGGNRDPAVRETAWIMATAHTTNRVILTETGPDTGVFAGAVPGLAEIERTELVDSPCNFHFELARVFTLSFSEDEHSLASSSSMLIDPLGFVFDSTTGAIIEGARVSVVEDATGLPATVIGDDGVSAYPSTLLTGSRVKDSSGFEYQLERGQFRFPLMNAGAYRLIVTPPPGYRGPSTATAQQLASYNGPNGRYHISDASFSRRFVLDSPEPLSVDIPLDPDLSSELLLDKTASARAASPGDLVEYRLRLTNRDARRTLPASTIRDSLPPGLRYRRGSTRGTVEPRISSDGSKLTFTAGALAGAATLDIRYVVEVSPGARQGEAVNRAQAFSGGATSNEAIAAIRIKPLLFSDAATLVGRVTEGDCGDPLRDRKGVAGVRIMLEDGAQTVTDRDGLYHFEGVKAGTHVVQLDRHSIAATHEPVACDRDTRQAGSAISRFVEASGGSLPRVDFQLRRTGAVAADKDALPITLMSDADAAGGGREWLQEATPGVDWLFPAMDHNPRAPAQRVVVKHKPGQRIALQVNGHAVDPVTFDGTSADEARGVAVSVWTGVPLGPRDNLLEARVLEADGSLATTLTRIVHFATEPVRAEYVAEQSRLIADGLSRPLVAVRVTDRDGKPVRAGTTIGFRVDQPYEAAIESDVQAQRQLAGLDGAPAFARVAGDQGLAFLALAPTMQAGAVKITTLLDESGKTKEVPIASWLTAAAQGWTVVGFGKGTLGYDTLRTHASALNTTGKHEVVTDGELRFYAKGRIKGSWLLTMAYDSDRKYDPDRGLLGTIDPDRYYTVYGDGSRQIFDAATTRKLYLRLERQEFRALFGDFETGMTETNLMRYNRTLNGVRAEYHGNRVTFTGFAAENRQVYGRDEIQGNGLSGPYRLSGEGIVPNSDKVRLETRDRYRSERIVGTQQLTRHIDYDIDPDAGTLRFREPVLSRDADLNPIFIVAEYETALGRSRSKVMGARAAVRVAENRVEVGASVLRDESAPAATVAGVDLKARLGRGTEVHAEAATGGRRGFSQDRAFEAEVIHQSRDLDASAYIRQQDSGFGLGQQNGVEAGTRKIGVDGKVRFTDRLSLAGSAWHQTNLEDAGRRIAADARLEYRTRTGTVYAGAQIASDTGIGGQKRDSRLLTLGGSQRPFGQDLEIFGETQLALGGKDESIDFPVRHKLGVAYQVKQGVRLIAEHEIAASDVKAHQTRLGFNVAPWSGGKLLGSVAQEAIGENGARTFAQYGLNQSVPLGKHWTVDATVDATTTVSGTLAPDGVINPLHPRAIGGMLDRDGGDGDHRAFTLGATYRRETWSWNGRAEYRRGSRSNRWGVTTSALRSLGEGKTLAAGLRAYEVTERDGGVAAFLSADVALALRPLDSRWSVLERLELRRERADADVRSSNLVGSINAIGGGQISTRLVNNLAVNYRTGAEGDGHGWEASFYHGAKYVIGRFGDDGYTGFIDVIGFDLRRDLGPRFDIGIQASRQHSWSSHATSYSLGPSLGFSPGNGVWMSAGYNLRGFHDRDFAEARYTRQGPFVTMRMKFDQLSLSAAARQIMGAAK